MRHLSAIFLLLACLVAPSPAAAPAPAPVPTPITPTAQGQDMSKKLDRMIEVLRRIEARIGKPQETAVPLPHLNISPNTISAAIAQMSSAGADAQ